MRRGAPASSAADTSGNGALDFVDQNSRSHAGARPVRASSPATDLAAYVVSNATASAPARSMAASPDGVG